MTYKTLSAVALAGAMTVLPALASAQVNPPVGGQRQRLELERRLQQGFHRNIQNQLGWDQTKMQGLQEIMRSFQEDRTILSRAQASLRHKLRDPALPDIGDAEALALLQEMVSLQQQELDLYRREQEELLTVMTPVELVRFYRLRDSLGQRLQQLRQGRGRGGGQFEGVGPGVRGTGGRPGGGFFR
jgi:hypothetical protein